MRYLRAYVGRVVNDARTGSNLIRVIDQLLQGSLSLAIQTVQLAGGDDGLAGLDDNGFIGSLTGKTGTHALDQVQDIALLLVPGRATSAVHNAMLRYCEVDRDGTVFAVLDPPAGIDAGRMFGVLGFETDEVLEERKRDLV